VTSDHEVDAVARHLSKDVATADHIRLHQKSGRAMDGASSSEPSGQWRLEAGCAGSPDPDMFFPDRNSSAVEALAICERCPVDLMCRAYAIEHQERDGIWGGLTEDQREQLLAASGVRRARRRPSSWTGLTRSRIGA
jgi:WhiB family redox-sensing transcriptional regulator